MRNSETSAALQYHNATKHSPESLLAGPRFLDMTNRPIPYKIYSSLEPIPLPTDFPLSDVAALDAIATFNTVPSDERIPDLQTLAQLCFFSNGITKRLRLASGALFPMRAAACTGALFHIELYIVCGDLPGLSAGIYHFGAHDNSLRQLRIGDFRQVLVQATAAQPAIAHAPAIMVCTSTFWRNAWKYRSRAYRHTFWDDGTILANTLAIAAATRVPTTIVLGFVDESVNRLLDIDVQHEAAVNLVALGYTNQEAPAAPPVVPLHLPTAQLSPKEVDYPQIWAMHQASSLTTEAEVAAWRGRPSLPEHRPSSSLREPLIPLSPLDPAALPNDPIETVIRRRGSTRQFTQEPISFAQLSTMLTHSLHSIPSDCFDPIGTPMSDLYFIVNAIDGLTPGTYVLHQEKQALELLRAGNFRYEAGHLALDQELGMDAAANIYFMADLEPVLERFGNRGYRVAQLEAAILGGKLYLAAYAFRLGATGLTFFDDEVTAFFSPHAAGKSVMFLIALGHPYKRVRR
jgi:SagB-type dehydrogenase family enzyme